jgi:hypothetical protein
MSPPACADSPRKLHPDRLSAARSWVARARIICGPHPLKGELGRTLGTESVQWTVALGALIAAGPTVHPTQSEGRGIPAADQMAPARPVDATEMPSSQIAGPAAVALRGWTNRPLDQSPIMMSPAMGGPVSPPTGQGARRLWREPCPPRRRRFQPRARRGFRRPARD